MDGLRNNREISFHTGVLASYQRLGLWEPSEPRGSLPVLREPGSEVPPGCSTRKREPGFLAFLDKRLASEAYWGNHFWAKGYCVDTVGLDAEVIRRYVKYQKDKERQMEQLNLEV